MSKGLNTASFVTGIMQGANFHEDLQNSKQMRGLRDSQNDRSERMMDIRESEHDGRMRNLSLNQDSAEMKNQDALFKLIGKQLISMDRSGAVEYSEGEEAILSKAPNLSLDFIMGEDVGKALESSKRVINSDDPTLINSPEGLHAINTLFPEINAGAGDGRTRQVVGVYPGKEEGKLVFDLSVEGEAEGKPLTVRRSADQDDPVKEVDVGDLVGKVASTGKLRQILSSPKGREFFKQYYQDGQQEFGDITTDSNTGVSGQYEKNTNRFMPVGGGRGGRGGSGMTSRQKDYNFAVNVLGMPDAQARDYAFSDSTPEERADDYAKKMLQFEKEKNEFNDEYDPASSYETHRDTFLKKYHSYDQEQKGPGGEPSGSGVDDFLSEWIVSPEGAAADPSTVKESGASGDTETAEQSAEKPAEPTQPKRELSPKEEGLLNQYLSLRSKVRAGGTRKNPQGKNHNEMKKDMADLEELLGHYDVEIPEEDKVTFNAPNNRKKRAEKSSRQRDKKKNDRIAALEGKFSPATGLADAR